MCYSAHVWKWNIVGDSDSQGPGKMHCLGVWVGLEVGGGRHILDPLANIGPHP